MWIHLLQAPVAKGTIPNFDLLLGASNVTIEASLYFSDANGDTLDLHRRPPRILQSRR